MTELTKDEAYAVADLIGTFIFDAIRANEDIDSMQWPRNIIHVYEKCCMASGYVGLTDEDLTEGITNEGNSRNKGLFTTE